MLDVGYIDSVGTSVSERAVQVPVSSSVSSSSESAAFVTLSDLDVVVPHVRIDTDIDRAILEYRSVKTGEVKRQFPTEEQLKAFAQAQSLVSAQEKRADLYGSSNKISSTKSTADAAVSSADTSSSSAIVVDKATISSAVSSYSAAASLISSSTSGQSSASSASTGFILV